MQSELWSTTISLLFSAQTSGWKPLINHIDKKTYSSFWKLEYRRDVPLTTWERDIKTFLSHPFAIMTSLRKLSNAVLCKSFKARNSDMWNRKTRGKWIASQASVYQRKINNRKCCELGLTHESDVGDYKYTWQSLRWKISFRYVSVVIIITLWDFSRKAYENVCVRRVNSSKEAKGRKIFVVYNCAVPEASPTRCCSTLPLDVASSSPGVSRKSKIWLWCYQRRKFFNDSHL